MFVITCKLMTCKKHCSNFFAFYELFRLGLINKITMKSRLLPLSVLLLFASLTMYSQQTKRVLFIGNSYTGVNNLPQIVANLAAANGDTLIFDSSTPGGYTFELHSTNTTTLGKIRSQDWDYVVLQEQSQRPSFSPGQVSQEVLPYAAKLNDSIKANNPCTETVFYMTWGRKYGDQSNCQFYPPICTFEGMQVRLRDSYMLMGNANLATVCPAGMAWTHSRRADSTINLWSGDNSHPSLAGSYLTACTFYATMFQKSPLGNSFEGGLPSNVATFLQNIADSTVMDSFPQWRINANLPAASFSANVNLDTVTFTDNSVNGIHYNWDFGDGNTSTAQSPIHAYGQIGTFEVTLIVATDCAADTLRDTVMVDQLINREEDLRGELIELFPNPSRGALTVSGQANEQQKMEIRVLDLQGKVVHQEQWDQPSGSFQRAMKLDLKAGLYMIEVRAGQQKQVRKWIVQ